MIFSNTPLLGKAIDTVTHSTLEKHSNKTIIVNTIGTPTNMAPEVWQNMAGTKVPMSQSIDVYSYGVIMFEVCYRTKAWKGVNFLHIIKKSVIAGKRPRYLSDDDSSSKEEKDGEDGIPEGFDPLLSKCWHQNAAMRPEFREILPFFRNASHTAIEIE